MVDMNGRLRNDSIYFEGIFIRPDGELDFFSNDIVSIRSKSIKEIMNVIKDSTDVEGTIEIYKVDSRSNEPEIHKIVHVYNDLDPLFNN